jgi:hypothetical protein
VHPDVNQIQQAFQPDIPSLYFPDKIDQNVKGELIHNRTRGRWSDGGSGAWADIRGECPNRAGRFTVRVRVGVLVAMVKVGLGERVGVKICVGVGVGLAPGFGQSIAISRLSASDAKLWLDSAS